MSTTKTCYVSCSSLYLVINNKCLSNADAIAENNMTLFIRGPRPSIAGVRIRCTCSLLFVIDRVDYQQQQLLF
jgi:hypothetical protein